MKRLIPLALALSLAGATAACVPEDPEAGDRQAERRIGAQDGYHHDWGRPTFDRDWGVRGADWDRQWRQGDRLPDGYWNDPRYAVPDFGYHHLFTPNPGERWVRYGDGFVLVRPDGTVDQYVAHSRW
jgi:Ni/Co efflux regulator RcnB